MSHHVTTTFKDNMHFTAKVNEFDVEMDDNHDDGLALGASPKKLMLASLAGCTGIDVVGILYKMKVHFSDFSIDTDAELTNDHPKTYKKVKITYRIKMAKHDHTKMEKAVSLSFNKYCGVSAMFSSFADLTTEIVYI